MECDKLKWQYYATPKAWQDSGKGFIATIRNNVSAKYGNNETQLDLESV